MKYAPVLFVVLLSIICLGQCKDLIVGTSFNNRLIWQQKIEYNAIPLKKRVKEAFYSDAGQQIIKVNTLWLKDIGPNNLQDLETG